jgi:hypothetical protein
VRPEGELVELARRALRAELERLAPETFVEALSALPQST